MRANIRWPREGRPLEGVLKRYYDFEIGPQPDDSSLARKIACYLLWLQAFNGREDNLASFDEFCLWIDGLGTLRAIADEKNKHAINPAPEPATIEKAAERFAKGLNASFDYVDNFRVAASLFSGAARVHATFRPGVVIGAHHAKIDPEFFASLLNYYYLHLVSNPKRKEYFRQAAEYFVDENTKLVDPQIVGQILLEKRIVPWSKIVDVIAHPSKHLCFD